METGKVNKRWTMEVDDYDDVLEPVDIKEIMKCGRDQAYNLCKSEKFRVIRVGRDMKIPKEHFKKWFFGV